MELDAAPVVDGVVVDILESGSRSRSDEHRHILHIESADKQQSVVMKACCISLHILKEYVSIYIGQEHVVGVALKERGVAAPCLDYFSYSVETCVVICRYSCNCVNINSIYA